MFVSDVSDFKFVVKVGRIFLFEKEDVRSIYSKLAQMIKNFRLLLI